MTIDLIDNVHLRSPHCTRSLLHLLHSPHRNHSSLHHLRCIPPDCIGHAVAHNQHLPPLRHTPRFCSRGLRIHATNVCIRDFLDPDRVCCSDHRDLRYHDLSIF